MTRLTLRLAICSLGAVCTLGIVSPRPTQGTEPASRPNVVLFLVDDMGWMDSSPYGSQYYETPHMQRLAHQSMRFTNAYATPLCSPTRASILSGQYSSRHGVTSASGHQPALPDGASRYPTKASPHQRFLYPLSKRHLDLQLDTLGEVMRDSGYRTGHFGKWHLGLSQEHWPEQHGFETAFHAEPSPGPRSYFSPYGIHESGEPSSKHHVGTITDGPEGEYITDRLTDEAIRFVETHQDEPFFLNFWHYAVHGPWGHKQEYTRQIADKVDPRGHQKNPIMASMLKSVDESLGRVLDKLDELKLTDNTLFIFYSDNGGNTHSNIPGARGMDVKRGHPKWEFVQDWKRWAGDQPPTNNAPLREGKGRIYEGGQRVPLMVRWPGKVDAGTISDAVVGPIDLYPTILDAIGAKTPTNHIVDGETIVPVLEQSGELKRQAYFTWFPHLIPAVSVRSGDWKLIRRFEPHGKYPEVRELYNLKDDIGETSNLASQMPEKVQQLDALIDQFVKDTGALVPKLNPGFNPDTKTRGAPKTAKNTGAMRTMDEFQQSTGLVPRMCRVALVDNALRITADGRQPFLGTAQVRQSGPMNLKLRVRGLDGGKIRVSWKKEGQDAFPENSQFANGDLSAGSSWQDITIPLPVKGNARVFRIYFPAKGTPVDVQTIRFMKGDDLVKSWEFVGEPE